MVGGVQAGGTSVLAKSQMVLISFQNCMIVNCCFKCMFKEHFMTIIKMPVYKAEKK